MHDQGIQLRDLFTKEIFQGVFITFFELDERCHHFNGPPDLWACQRDLGRIIQNPLITRFLFVGSDGFGQMKSNRFALFIQKSNNDSISRRTSSSEGLFLTDWARLQPVRSDRTQTGKACIPHLWPTSPWLPWWSLHSLPSISISPSNRTAWSDDAWPSQVRYRWTEYPRDRLPTRNRIWIEQE